MKKPGQFALRRLKDQRRNAVRKHWRSIAIAGLFYCALMTIVIAYVAVFARPMLSFTLGGILVGLAWFCKEIAAFLTPVGNLPYGALAEEWTAHMLKKARREWTVIHGLEFLRENGACSDIDHVAVGPRGVLAIETKFLGQKRAGEAPWRLNDHLAQARWGAAKIRLKLTREHRLPVEVTPVLCLWGPGADDVAGPVYTQDVLILAKPKDVTWLEAVPTRLSDETREATVKALQDFARRQVKTRADAIKRHAPRQADRRALRPAPQQA